MDDRSNDKKKVERKEFENAQYRVTQKVWMKCHMNLGLAISLCLSKHQAIKAYRWGAGAFKTE